MTNRVSQRHTVETQVSLPFVPSYGDAMIASADMRR
jgi:hypothetical protein